MRVLLPVDIQKGFCPGGNLPVPSGDEVVPVINALMASGLYEAVVLSQDWHPANHGSFASQHDGMKPGDMGELAGRAQMFWPDHCVQGTVDAEFHDDLDMAAVDYIQRKGENPLVDSYSAFRDNSGDALTGLHRYLIDKGVTEIDVCGLATDYCVRFTAEDAVDLLPGVKVRVIADASRGITPNGVADALKAMEDKGIEVITSKGILGG